MLYTLHCLLKKKRPYNYYILNNLNLLGGLVIAAKTLALVRSLGHIH